ncbi:J domain-containing protein [Paludisphaera mucosa]|uniref:J domain-containing protein n=1 Tax=Paludisphaera mucosa TaxID=3030827 RepID=A0ABT6F7P2_9BACT|nr:J domain-containing protein [Paludisphaera mucosa]MDG3003433.1 J domain-containing protein [Paludisphaera mucosa]
MFLRFRKSGGRTYWRVVQSYREDGWPRQRTIYDLGPHDTREAAQAAWDALAASNARGAFPKPRPRRISRNSSTDSERAGIENERRKAASQRLKDVLTGQASPPPESVHPALAELGLGTEATLEQIKSAYRRLAAANHPDRGGNPDAMVQINQAYETALELLGAGKRPNPRRA